MLNSSRLYSFLDMKNGCALHFFDGQKMVYDLALIHPLQGEGFAYFRDTVLSALPMICFLKHGESLGIYLDSDDPFFRLKIETNHGGHTRTLLLPEGFNQFPEHITGEARVTKQFPTGHAAYTSVVQFVKKQSKQVINEILQTSYQANAEIVVSEDSDQSFLLIKLPPVNIDKKTEDETPSLAEFLNTNKNFFESIFKLAHNDVDKIVKDFEKSEFAYLSSRQVELFCPCSKDRMMDNLRMMFMQDPEALFAGDDTLEAKCDYCKKTYIISRADLSAPITNGPLN
jgi:molecular chaperone Hsp33